MKERITALLNKFLNENFSGFQKTMMASYVPKLAEYLTNGLEKEASTSK